MSGKFLVVEFWDWGFGKLNFGFVQLAEDQYARLKESYDEQKAQLLMSSAYTDWGDSNA